MSSEQFEVLSKKIMTKFENKNKNLLEIKARLRHFIRQQKEKDSFLIGSSNQ